MSRDFHSDSCNSFHTKEPTPRGRVCVLLSPRTWHGRTGSRFLGHRSRPRPCGRPRSQPQELPLPCWRRQRRQPPQDRPEQPPCQAPLRQRQPVIPGVLMVTQVLRRRVYSSAFSPALGGIENTGFPFSRLRAEALWRASTGMTERDKFGIYGQTLIRVCL